MQKFLGHAVFVPHALLLRGILYSLWREDEKGLKDLRDLVTRQGIEKKVLNQQRDRCLRMSNIHSSNACIINADVCGCFGETSKDIR